MDDRYEVKVENVFEGPMDLLVYLIKKHELDIYDIPIALITEQYLKYIEWMKAMNINLAGDFLLMASTLAHIKSRMLLPVHDASEEDAEDPRMEIVRPLTEYLSMKSVAEQLAERDMLEHDTFVRGRAEELTIDRGEQMIDVGLFELLDAFQEIVEKIPRDHRVDLTEDRFSIRDKIAHIIDILEQQTSAAFHDLFSKDGDREELIVTFLAILEMAKLGLICIAQHVQTGIIRLFYL
jgi:segregation and condensation protein A